MQVEIRHEHEFPSEVELLIFARIALAQWAAFLDGMAACLQTTAPGLWYRRTSLVTLIHAGRADGSWSLG